MNHNLFKPQNIEDAKNCVVGDCNGFSMEERYRVETPLFAKAILENIKFIAGGVPENRTEEIKRVKPETEKEEKVDPSLDELISYLKNGDGYLATVTVLSNGKLSHHMITKTFPDLDILKSLAAVEKMAVERLKAL